MVLKLESISKTINNFSILSNINLQVNEGEALCILGANGSGKSTLMKILSTLISPTSGYYYLDGLNVLESPDSFKSCIGYLPQDVPYYPHLTGFEFLEFISAIKGCDEIDAKNQITTMLKILNLYKYKDVQLFKYSGGMKRRIGICSALLGDSRILILDEPTAGLDMGERVNFLKFVNTLSRNIIVIFTSHIISDVRFLASHLMILNKGKIIFYGTPEEFAKNYGDDFELSYIRLLEALEEDE